MQKRLICFLIVIILILAIFGYFYFLEKTSLSPKIETKQEIQGLKEETIQLEGKLEIAAYDTENPRFDYFILSNGKRVPIEIVGQPLLNSGQLVSVKGKQIDGKILIQPQDIRLDEQPTFPKDGRSTPETLGDQRTAVILVRFNDSNPTPPFSVEQINNFIFNGTFQRFYREASFNKMWFTGHTFGWYTLNRESDLWCDEEEVIQISDSDIYFPDYDRIIVLCDNRPWGMGADWATIGKWELTSQDGNFNASFCHIGEPEHFFDEIPLPSGGTRAYSWTLGAWTTTHEVGHNLDYSHANNWECGNETLYGDCTSGEYGNFFDIMGRGHYFLWDVPLAALHPSAPFKERMGWINQNNTLEITQNGSYLLKPLEKENAIIARVEQPGYPQLPPYYLEYRIPYGYDNSLTDPLSIGNLNGIFINSIYPEVYYPPQGEKETIASHILDMSPHYGTQFDTDWYNVALSPNKTFFDQGSGIKIKNNGLIYSICSSLIPSNKIKNYVLISLVTNCTTALNFSVEFSEPICVRIKPNIRTFIDYFEGIPGENLSIFALNLRNVDSVLCANSTFQVSLEVPEGWSSFISPSHFILMPSEMFYGFEETSVFIPDETPLGLYQINFTVTNLDSGLFSKANLTINVARHD
jgi:hypothetical protein